MDPRFTQKHQQAAEMKRAAKQIQQAVMAGQLTVIDRIGQPIEKGALVAWKTPIDMIWEVIECVPVLDPGAPPGAVRLVMHCTTPAMCGAGQPQMSMIRVGTQQSEGHASLDKVEAPTEEIPQLGEEAPLQPPPNAEPS